MLAPATLQQHFAASPLAALSDEWLAATATALQRRPHGLWSQWQAMLAALPPAMIAEVADYDLTTPTIRLGTATQLTPSAQARLRANLMQLQPWRKGPFAVCGVVIDAEWRSDTKWARLENYLQPLRGRRVLDVGCGNGYYMLRMLGLGAEYVLGIEPSPLFIAQFHALTTYLPPLPASILPLRCEELPLSAMAAKQCYFDTVFSMGVLYHRRDPHQHLQKLRQCLRPGGELVLETLMVESADAAPLRPRHSYAKMPNVTEIPSLPMLTRALAVAGFDEIVVVDCTVTTAAEQRRTEWMTFESLTDFLDPQQQHLTVEGYPAPMRAALCCRRAE